MVSGTINAGFRRTFKAETQRLKKCSESHYTQKRNSKQQNLLIKLT